MKELRNSLSKKVVARTGTLEIFHVVDVQRLKADADATESVSTFIDALEGGGRHDVVLERRGKTKTVFTSMDGLEAAEAFVAGFRCCADVRREGNKRPKKPKGKKKPNEKPAEATA